jgi:regulatory protein
MAGAAPRSLSLKGRALMWLSQREHSRSELRRKLLARLQADAAAGAEPFDSPEAGCQVETLLDWLEAQRYLSEARFAESRVHARAARFGTLRIAQELSRHGVALESEALQQLRDSELPRAREVWVRKFGAPAGTPAERAKQMRFLAGRGFSGDVIRRIVLGADNE